MRSSIRRATTRRSPTSFPFDETPDQAAAIDAVIADMTSGKPMDRLVCGDVGFGKTEVALRAAFIAVDGRQAGRVARADDAAGRAAHADVLRPLRGLAGADRRDVALPLGEGSRGRGQGHQRRHARHRHRHAQAAVAGRALRAARPGHHRRGASLRRAPQGADEGAARRGRRADADRDADPAHARHESRRAARILGHRDGAAEAARDQDVRASRGRRHDPRGRAARAQARRPGVLTCTTRSRRS